MPAFRLPAPNKRDQVQLNCNHRAGRDGRRKRKPRNRNEFRGFLNGPRRTRSFGPLTPSQRATLQQVEDSAHDLLDLVDALLDLSRVEHGATILDLQDTDVGKLLREIEVQMQPLQKQAGLTFRCHVPASLAPLRTDRTLLKLLLRNLIENAFKFTNHGGVTVAVGSRHGGIEMIVADTGIGMAPETLRLIFEPFHQAEPAHPTSRRGAGLGLFIVRRILQTLNGTTHVDSTLGCGSTFRVWLPNTLPPATGARAAAGPSIRLQGPSDCAAAS